MIAGVTPEEFVDLKKMLQTETGALLIRVMRKASRVEPPAPGSDLSQAGVLGTLYGSAVGFQSAVDILETFRESEGSPQPKQDVESTYTHK